MKKIILGKCMDLVKKNNPTYQEEKLEEIRYGLESIYLTYTKIFLIFVLAYFLGIIKETLLLLVTYNIIRTFAFGIHATKSIYCLITSLMLFIGGVYVVKYMSLNIYVKAIISIILLICIYKYAPADTYKRPLINERKRKKYKVISTILGIAYVILIIIFNNYIISNYLLIGMLETVIMIHPIVYKIFNLPFDNYKKYKLNAV
ncbi:MAG: accessory gene regulator B family protein [Bacilli bacterium]